MKKVFLIALMAASTPMVPQVSLAADTSDGCGVGWSVTQSTTLSATTTRGTTNSFLPNTFSMTSGTSGCAKHPIAKNDQPAFEYAMVNYDSLSIEMAQGHGENLTAFARTLGCGDAFVPLFSQMARREYPQIFGKGKVAPAELFDQVKGQIQSDALLSLACRT